MAQPLSTALFREVRPEFFRILSGTAARLYVDALGLLEEAVTRGLQAIERDDALNLIEQAVEEHAEVPLEDGVDAGLGTREKARAVLEVLRRAGWLEEEERSDWRKLVHLHPNGIAMLQTLRRLAFPEAAVFSDSLVGACTQLSQRDALYAEPWQLVESCVTSLQTGIMELRGMQKAIERHTRQQLAATTLKENLEVLFDRFAERIGHACYSELVHARLPMRLAEARRQVAELENDADALSRMQAELLRRESALAPETAMSRVHLRLEELIDLLQSVVPVADAVDRRTAEFTRRSLARFRYLQETTSENRARVLELFEALNKFGAGRRVADLDADAIDFPALRLQETRLLAGLESLYTPRLRRAAGEIEPLDEEASDEQQDDALRRLHAAMRDSMTVARANRFAEQLFREQGPRVESHDLKIRCEEDLADVIACLLNAHAGDARFRVEVPRAMADNDTAQFDSKLSYRLERFTLTRK
jgi:hypothetical protein